MFKQISQDTHDQIVSRIKNNGEAVSALSSEYNVLLAKKAIRSGQICFGNGKA